MKRKVLLGLMIFTTLLSGCNKEDINKILEYKEKNYKISEYVDKETGVHYLIYKEGYKGGITVRYNADGSVYTTKITK